MFFFYEKKIFIYFLFSIAVLLKLTFEVAKHRATNEKKIIMDNGQRLLFSEFEVYYCLSLNVQ